MVLYERYPFVHRVYLQMDGMKIMFGRKGADKQNDVESRIEALELEKAELEAKLKCSETELDAVNTSTHLGIWKFRDDC